MAPRPDAPDAHWSLPADAYPALPRAQLRNRSLALTMRDGVRIAVTLWLPPSLRPGERVATLLHQTRYYRALAPRLALRPLPVAEVHDLYAHTRRRALGAGYAWLDVDVRGSGASGGAHPHPWSADEVLDAGQAVDWLTAQPFSDGRVGALGISYSGTAAEMLLRTHRKAVRAVAPCFSLFDVYSDVAFPGGLHLHWFTEAWGAFNLLLDKGDFATAMSLAVWNIARSHSPWLESGPLASVLRGLTGLPRERFVAVLRTVLFAMASGVRPLDEDTDGSQLRAAIAAHAHNFDVHQGALRVTCRDDRQLDPEQPALTIDDFSPHHYLDALRAAGTAVYSVGGWRDAAYAHAAIKRFGSVRTAGSRLTLGPWGHGGQLAYQPGKPVVEAGFDQGGELLRFFDVHVRERDGYGLAGEAPVHYFTTGEERWKSAPSWPPAGTVHEPLHLTAARTLSFEEPRDDEALDVLLDPLSGGGESARWRGLLGGMIRCDESDVRPRDAHRTCFDSDHLGADCELTGHPMLHLWVQCDAPDASVFAYLEELLPDGRSVHLTEGLLRALHRAVDPRPGYHSPVPSHSYARADARPLEPGVATELRFDLLPLSHRVRRGSRLRLALALADRDLFAPVPGAARSLRVLCSPSHPSRLVLPFQR